MLNGRLGVLLIFSLVCGPVQQALSEEAQPSPTPSPTVKNSLSEAEIKTVLEEFKNAQNMHFQAVLHQQKIEIDELKESLDRSILAHGSVHHRKDQIKGNGLLRASRFKRQKHSG